jgi:hypothetical protein
MPRIGIGHLTTIRNSIIRTGYFQVQWKVAQIIMIPKPGKLLEQASSYRPISLLPTMRKIFEKAMLKRLRPIPEENRILPDHQFGFGHKHSTTEQVRRITEIIKGTALRRSCTSHKRLIKYGTQATCSTSEKPFPTHITEY